MISIYNTDKLFSTVINIIYNDLQSITGKGWYDVRYNLESLALKHYGIKFVRTSSTYATSQRWDRLVIDENMLTYMLLKKDNHENVQP